MKIDGILVEDVQTIKNNYDNLGILKIVNWLIGSVVNDVDYINSDIDRDTYDLLLGNSNYIKREDLESLYSIIDTIKDIENYNKEV